MQAEPKNRHQTAAAFAAEIEQWLADTPAPPPSADPGPVTAPPDEAVPRPAGSTSVGPRFVDTDIKPRPPRSDRLKAVLAGGVIGLAAAATGILLYEAKSPRSAPTTDTAPR